MLHNILDAIEKVASDAANRRELAKHGLTQKKINDESNKHKGVVTAAGVGAAGGLTAREGAHYILGKAMMKNRPDEAEEVFEALGDSYRRLGKVVAWRKSLTEGLKDPTFQKREKALLLATKKRVMLPIGAALGISGYLAARKKDK